MGLRGALIGAIIDVILLAMFIQVGLLSPSRTLQETIMFAVVFVAVKYILKKLFGG